QPQPDRPGDQARVQPQQREPRRTGERRVDVLAQGNHRRRESCRAGRGSALGTRARGGGRRSQ
ncbi:MAG: hypothetical protein ABI747_04150, partial [Candidatus Moraniibacteriota bacterium]